MAGQNRVKWIVVAPGVLPVDYACASQTRAACAARATGACWHGWRRPVNRAAPPRACVRAPRASWASEGV
eukprot:5577325-Pleurochrysis_carterae.AAC.1